jgi:two-component SAPR family response regulator
VRAILVDDERLALAQLKKLLERDIGDIEVIGMYTDPLQVCDQAQKLRPDAVFLDIQMPGIDGLELGERLQSAVPEAEIVFVTAYDQYAVQAFELHALDYLMKPVQLDRLQKTIDRLKDRSFTGCESGTAEEPPVISCFHQIKFQLPGGQPLSVKWRTSKAQELFAYLLHHRDRTVDRETLFELLWPDFDSIRAAKQLYTTIYHIRQTLKSAGLQAVTIHSGELEVGYKLTIGEARLDVAEWEARLKRLPALEAGHLEEHEQVLRMYKGHYLGEVEYLWAEHERERLRRLWMHHAEGLSDYYLERGMIVAALQVNQRIQQYLPYDEESYFTLMKLYDSLGDTAGVEDQYWLLTSRLERELDSAVSPAITKWYDSWKEQRGRARLAGV